MGVPAGKAVRNQHRPPGGLGRAGPSSGVIFSIVVIDDSDRKVQ
jgi:hypothetical protein